MPIYEYRCNECEITFELKQSIKEEAVAACTKCGKPVGRIISAPAIMFKGTGWYITDYSDKMKPPSGDSAKASPTSSTPAKAETAAPASSTPAPASPAPTAPSSSGSTGSGSGGSSTSS